MGQQQLLFLVLGIIIVGLAVIMGITMFGINQSRGNADNMVAEALRIASDVQAWAIKPQMLGGMTRSETFSAVSFDKIGYPTSGGTYSTPNGDYILSTSLGSNCETPSIPSGKTALVYINASNAGTGSFVCIAVAGTAASDIGTDANYGSGITS